MHSTIHLALDFWRDEHGFVISAELVLIGTILVLGLVTGLVCVRDAVNAELTDVADAIGSLNQSYGFTGQSGCWSWRCGLHSFTNGSCFVDLQDRAQAEFHFDGPCVPALPRESVPVVPHVIEPPVICEPLPAEPSPCPCPTPCPPTVIIEVHPVPCPPAASVAPPVHGPLLVPPSEPQVISPTPAVPGCGGAVLVPGTVIHPAPVLIW